MAIRGIGFSRRNLIVKFSGKGMARAIVSLSRGLVSCVAVIRAKRTFTELYSQVHCHRLRRSLISRWSKTYRLYFCRTTSDRTIDPTPCQQCKRLPSHSHSSASVAFSEGPRKRVANCTPALLRTRPAMPFHRSLAARRTLRSPAPFVRLMAIYRTSQSPGLRNLHYVPPPVNYSISR